MNIKSVIAIIGLIIIFIGTAMLIAIPFSLYYSDGSIGSIIISSLICFSVGAVLYFSFKQTSVELGVRDGFAVVTFSWIAMSIFGSLPFLISGYIPSITDAFFETVSGFTTTGASILKDVEALPSGLLFWRSMTQWIGGMGIIVMSIAILPILGVGGMQLFKAEAPGHTVDKIKPRIGETAKVLWKVYILFSAAQTLLLMIGGLSFFEALNHTFATMATGGFSTKNASVAHFNSPYIDIVITIFMFMAGVNFVLHYRGLNGDVKSYFKNSEFLFYSGLTILAIILTSVFLLFHGNYSSIGEVLRFSSFQVVSIFTTTGFATADYELWPIAIQFFLFLLMFIGGCAGSTGGGIKNMRLLILLRNGTVELRKLIHPKAILPVRFNGRIVPQEIINNILALFAIFITTFVIATIIMTALGLDIISAMGAVVASLSNIGPGMGSVGPTDNYSHIPILGKWILSACMIIGRLEFFTVLVIFSRVFWKI
ncbi:MAG: TrkH family potassium uptake protein [Ignavibacteriales bacterium]|nr:TrkH family potassium uptake protein [Ignavibacteriales bacterium]